MNIKVYLGLLLTEQPILGLCIKTTLNATWLKFNIISFIGLLFSFKFTLKLIDSSNTDSVFATFKKKGVCISTP